MVLVNVWQAVGVGLGLGLFSAGSGVSVTTRFAPDAASCREISIRETKFELSRAAAQVELALWGLGCSGTSTVRAARDETDFVSEDERSKIEAHSSNHDAEQRVNKSASDDGLRKIK